MAFCDIRSRLANLTAATRFRCPHKTADAEQTRFASRIHRGQKGSLQRRYSRQLARCPIRIWKFSSA